MHVVQDLCIALPVALLTAALVLGIAAAIGLSSWALL